MSPVLGNNLDFAKLEARNFRAHILSAAPSSPVTGQLYYDTVGNVLYWWDGTVWQAAKSGAAGDATASVKGLIQLAGDLGGGGTAAAPVIASGAITAAKIASGTITDVQVAAANKDGVAGTASMRTLGAGATQAMAGNATPSGPPTGAASGDLGSTYPAPTVTNLHLAADTAINHKLTTLTDPTAAQDAATKNYVDTVAQGLSAKTACVAATTANITLSGLQAIDGYTTLANDRVLVKNQTTASANGIYVAASGAWTRALDMDVWAEVPSAFAWVEQGTAQADTGWVCTNDPGGTLGTTSITWVQFSGAAMITAGAGITKSGNTLSANVDNASIDTAGAGTSLEVKAGGITAAMHATGSVNLASAVVTGTLGLGNGGTGQTTAKAARETGLGSVGYYSNSATHGAGTTITITQATHGLRSSRAIHVQVQDNTTGNVELPDISVASNGDVTVTYAASVSANSKLVSLVG